MTNEQPTAQESNAANVCNIMSRQVNPEETLMRLELVYLTVQQVAKLLHVKTGTIYSWISADKIPYKKAGGKPLFLATEIETWVMPQSDKPSRRRKSVDAQQAQL